MIFIVSMLPWIADGQNSNYSNRKTKRNYKVLISDLRTLRKFDNANYKSFLSSSKLPDSKLSFLYKDAQAKFDFLNSDLKYATKTFRLKKKKVAKLIIKTRKGCVFWKKELTTVKPAKPTGT